MNYANWYEKITRSFSGEGAKHALKLVDRGAVLLLGSAYIGSLLALASTVNPLFWKALIVPLIAFAAVSAIRKVINAPRPSEKAGIDPLIPVSTQGYSFPSRHMASAVVIALELQWLWVPMGVVAWIICAIIAFTRIVGGAHFPKDVLGGFVFSLVIGIVGFYAIP